MSKYLRDTTTVDDLETSLSTADDHGELRRIIANYVGVDETRYSEERGNERHRKLLADDIDAVCDALEIGFIDGTKQQKRDAIMIKVDRDHRTGVDWWDTQDCIAVIHKLEQEIDTE